MNDKQLLIISLICSVLGLIIIGFSDFGLDIDLKIVNITQINGNFVELTFCSNITGRINTNITSKGRYGIAYTDLGEDFYYITGLQLINGST